MVNVHKNMTLPWYHVQNIVYHIHGTFSKSYIHYNSANIFSSFAVLLVGRGTGSIWDLPLLRYCCISAFVLIFFCF